MFFRKEKQKEPKQPTKMVVYLIEYGVHYETHFGGIFFKKEDADKELIRLEKECEEDSGCLWNGGEVIEVQIK